jgi:ADP-ribosylglycohydrolase
MNSSLLTKIWRGRTITAGEVHHQGAKMQIQGLAQDAGLSRIKGCLLGLHLGDALGLPFEGMTQEQVSRITGPEGITTFVNPRDHIEGLHDGICEGDGGAAWPLTRMAMDSIHGNYNLANLSLFAEWQREAIAIVNGHSGLVHPDTEGIKRADDALNGTTPVYRRQVRDQLIAHGLESNYMMTYMPAFGLRWSHLDFEADRDAPERIAFENMVYGACSVMHPDPAAILSAYAIANMIARCAGDSGGPLVLRQIKEYFMGMELDVMHMRERLFAGDQKLQAMDATGSIMQVRNLMMVSRSEMTLSDMVKSFGTSRDAIQSVAFCLAMLLRNGSDFRKALQETIAVGGATGSNAAIVGALVGACVGRDGIDLEWDEFIGRDGRLVFLLNSTTSFSQMLNEKHEENTKRSPRL